MSAFMHGQWRFAHTISGVYAFSWHWATDIPPLLRTTRWWLACAYIPMSYVHRYLPFTKTPCWHTADIAWAPHPSLFADVNSQRPRSLCTTGCRPRMQHLAARARFVAAPTLPILPILVTMGPNGTALAVPGMPLSSQAHVPLDNPASQTPRHAAMPAAAPRPGLPFSGLGVEVQHLYLELKSSPRRDL